MNYEVTGKLIYKEATQKISDRFQKREFVIEVENEKNPQWNDFVKVQLIQDRCDLLETIQLNENVFQFAWTQMGEQRTSILFHEPRRLEN